jgi:hypothetical protein
MPGIVCGIIDPAPGTEPAPVARARDLTVSWLRWGYFGDILEERDAGALLLRAAEAGYDYCVIQGWGHILAEHSSPQGGRALSFFDALRQWLDTTNFCMAGTRDRFVIVDLRAWEAAGRPPVDAHPLTAIGPELSPYLIDLQSDLSGSEAFLAGLEALCEKAARGVFVLNYEPYRDVETPPAGFEAPVSVLYSVAAGLKPNRILETHGFDERTRVVFFDYSREGLLFRQMLHEEWDGRDYPGYLRGVFARRPGETHYYLWPGAAPEDLDWNEMGRLWAAELARWGGEEALASHWSRYRALRHEYRLCNILSQTDDLLEAIEDRPGAVVWWSNAFATVFSAMRYSLEEKRRIYDRWVDGLARKAPRILLYGSDHSNSSVNCTTAAEYWERYSAEGGDPLRGRRLHQHEIRF